MDNLYIKQSINCVREDIIGGLSLHRALAKQPVFPIALRQMVDVGEESGSLHLSRKKPHKYMSEIFHCCWIL